MTNPDTGFVRNCHVSSRFGEEPLFIVRADGTVTAHLDGYVICPLEEVQEIARRLADVVPDKSASAI